MHTLAYSPSVERSTRVNPVNTVEALPEKSAGNTVPSQSRKALEGVTTKDCGYGHEPTPITVLTSAGLPEVSGDEIVCSCGMTARSQDKEPGDNTKEICLPDHRNGGREPQQPRGHCSVMGRSKAGELLEPYSLETGHGNQQAILPVTVGSFRDYAEYTPVRVETRTSTRPQESLGEDIVRYSVETRRLRCKLLQNNDLGGPRISRDTATGRPLGVGFLHGLPFRVQCGVPACESSLNKQGELLEPYSPWLGQGNQQSIRGRSGFGRQGHGGSRDYRASESSNPGTSPLPLSLIEGEDIVRYSLETRSVEDKEPQHNRCVTGQAKGNIPRGSDIWNARTGHPDRFNHTNDVVPQEVVFVEATGVTTYQCNTAYRPVKPGTVTMVEGSNTWVDDANGTLTGANLTSGTINYATGQIDVVISTAVNGRAVTATYQFDVEGNDTIQQLDFQITSSPVFAQERKLRGRWSTEAAQVLQALHGLDAEAQVSTAIANEIQFNNTDWLRSNAHVN